jgi:hypothetical protein
MNLPLYWLADELHGQSALKDVWRQISALLTTEWTLGNDP